MEIKSLYIQIQNCMTSVLSVLLNTCPNQFFFKKTIGGWGGEGIFWHDKKYSHAHCTKRSSLMFLILKIRHISRKKSQKSPQINA